MLVYAEKAQTLCANRDGAALAADDAAFLAIQRCLEIIGEAANQTPLDVQAAYPWIPFRAAIAMRHKIVHGYRMVDPAIIAETIRTDLPGLVAAIRQALSAPLPDER